MIIINKIKVMKKEKLILIMDCNHNTFIDINPDG